MKYIITERQYRVIAEEVSPRIKEIIFNKLLNDMKNAEIIEDNDDIWAIDPDEKYWYFQLKKDGTLWWRWDFFNDFFKLFSLEKNEYEPILRDMVEHILNRQVKASNWDPAAAQQRAEDVIDRKIKTSTAVGHRTLNTIKNVIDRKVKRSERMMAGMRIPVDAVLDRRNKKIKDENF